MHKKPFSALQNEYQQIALFAKTSGEPVYITDKNGDVELVVLGAEAFEEREKMLEHRASILEAELMRLSGAPSCTNEEMHTRLEKQFADAAILKRTEIPNAVTRKAIEDAENGIGMSKAFSSVAELMAELNAED